jgi:hypothetical protein
MPKKQTQRGCALSKRRRKHHNKSAKQRGGSLHKMYNYNTLDQDPQRMLKVDHGIQAGGKKHGHSRKYLKHGGSDLKRGGSDLKRGGSDLKRGGSAMGALNTVIGQISTRFMPESMPVDYVSKTESTLV